MISSPFHWKLKILFITLDQAKNQNWIKRNMYLKKALFTWLLVYDVTIIVIGNHNSIKMRGYVKNYAINIAYQGRTV